LNRFDQGNFSSDCVAPCLSEALGPHQEHRERIHNELREFLSEREARETATQVYNLALEIDEDIGRILKDPLARRLYEYDGQFFTPRDTPGFHVAFDGLHPLRSLSDSKLDGFFRGRKKHFAIRLMLDELGKHAWVAKRRRLNWEESNNLGLVPKGVLDAIIKDALEREKAAKAEPLELSLEEQAFFQSYEAQMERHP
jgi:hypothetical protein